MKILRSLFTISLLLGSSVALNAQAAQRSIAITIDDLPVVSTRTDIKNRREITKRLIGHLKSARVPAIGFVNEDKLYKDSVLDDQQVGLLRRWIEAGLELGNHTYSHRSLNRIQLAEYQEDLIKGEKVTAQLLTSQGRKLRYFRHPFLQTGRTAKVKAEFDKFLCGRGYTIAPITFDNADYIFSRAYDIAFDRKDKKLLKQVGDAYVPYMEAKLDYWERQSIKLFGREVSQTMLIHANFINSVYMDDLVRMLNRRGYRIVSLEESLKDDAYRLPDNYVGPAGISWLHRWALDKGREYIIPDEPSMPEFVLKLSGFESE